MDEVWGVTIWAGPRTTSPLAPTVISPTTRREFFSCLPVILPSAGFRTIVGDVAKVLYIPPHVLNGPVLNVFLDQCRRGESSQLNLTEATRLFECASGGWESNARRDDDAL